jgi:hypothetical protein
MLCHLRHIFASMFHSNVQILLQFTDVDGILISNFFFNYTNKL